MRATFAGFEVGRKGLSVTQRALDITGQNLANIDTPGYTRQRVDLFAVSGDVFRTRMATPRSQFAGQGVDISGIAQTRDSFLDRRFRESYADVSYHAQAGNILDSISAAVDEIGGTGLHDAFDQLIKAVKDNQDNANSSTFANLLRTNFKSITQLMQQFDNQLTTVTEQYRDDLEIAVDDVNMILEKISGLNQSIAENMASSTLDRGTGYGPNELLDQRNLLLDELAQYGNITTSEQKDGTVEVKMNGQKIVYRDERTKRFEFDRMSFQSQDNQGTVSLSWQSTGKAASLGSGALKASVDYINGRGPGAVNGNETMDKGILYYRDKMDSLAQVFANTVNRTIPDATSPTGFKTLVGALVPDPNNPGEYITRTDVQINAKNISISDEWSKNADYSMFDSNSTDTNPLSTLLTALQSDKHLFRSRGADFDGTFQEFLKDYNADCDSTGSYENNRFMATSTIADDLLNQRSSVSGVFREEEGMNMMQYQKSFQAMSRLMTAMDEALDVIINRMGKVGL